MLKARIGSDLKTAMLSGDKTRVEILKMLKTAILYKEVELGVRDEGLTEEQTIDVLSKEAKKRLDAADMYEKAGNSEKAQIERDEQLVVSEYLPEQATDEAILTVVEATIARTEGATIKDMGKIIGKVKSQLGNTADGSRIATIVKQKLA